LRIYHYKQIKEIINTLREAQSTGLYADCQDGVEALLAFLDNIEADCVKTVELLEQYYRLIYSASLGEADVSCLDEQIGKINESIETESKPFSIEIAFITHKASMSDSIESVYFAANADPFCDAFWIPIPHILLNMQREPDTVQFEGADHYDSGVKITSWQEYDMETRHPDAIFIFNPYDKHNGVSVVHPDYFSERLRDFTDLLVYIPYYVDIDVGSADGYCLLPGCVNSNKVILSTKKMRDVFTERFKQKYGDRFGNPEEKFVALGSPKYDKAITAKREDYELPPPWRELAGDRKIVSYISSIASSLAVKSRCLDKLDYILNMFRERKDVLLWWRPHPFLDSAFKALTPDILLRYRQIVADYQREGWGIYDDTSNLHRAIAWGDGVYGDWSSVHLLYQVAGKPAMVADTMTFYERVKPCLIDCRFEDETDTLSRFIDDVIKGTMQDGKSKNAERGIINADGTAGKVIYEYSKSIILDCNAYPV